MKSEFLTTLTQRGYIHQCTGLEELDTLAAQTPVSAYIGFDCTAPSLHVGSLLQIMKLRILQKTGHRPIVLMGGGTTRIGDPSGKDESRQLLSAQEITANMDGIAQVFAKFLRFDDSPTGAVMVNNADWLSQLEYIPFLREYGRHFTINRMLAFDSVKLRLEREHALTFLEFNYMILQAFDFLQLARKYECRLQMGGSDQWGNIINGIELGRRADNIGLFGLTSPLITTSSGAKMGKTAQGALWLNKAQTSTYDYWQYWRNVDDGDVGRFLRLFTELPLAEIEKLERLQGVEINDAKKILANEATQLCHGPDASREAENAAGAVFEDKTFSLDMPGFEVAGTELEAGIAIFELFYRTGLSPSKGEARRLIRGGGARLNDQGIDDENRLVSSADLRGGDMIKLSAGKKRHILIRRV